jgi:lactate dehydrogenase-like 2-hydroxyacid dehydrogenase
MKPKVLITRIPPGNAMERIAKVADPWIWRENRRIDRDVLLEEAAGAVGIYSMLTDTIDVAVLDRAPELKVVSNMAVGVDNIDLAHCQKRGIAVGHTPGVLTDTTADVAWMLLMAASRRMVEGIDQVRQGLWGPWDPSGDLSFDVAGTTLGVIGMGRIGRAVAARAVGFSMDIVYAARTPKLDVEEATSARFVTLDELYTVADHIVVAVDLNDSTRGLIDSDALGAMKPTANLVNVSRGAVVDTDALVEALATGSIRCAGLDVTDPEPLPSNHPLVALPNCTIVPHIGSSTWRTRVAMADLAADNLIEGIFDRPLVRDVFSPS